MRTYRFVNRHGREVNVAEEGAVLLFKNPSMKFVGEVITKTEIKDVKKTRPVIVEKVKYKTVDGKKKRETVEVEETEEYIEKEMVTTQELDENSYPDSNTNDILITSSGTIRQKGLLTGSGGEVKRSTLDNK